METKFQEHLSENKYWSIVMTSQISNQHLSTQVCCIWSSKNSGPSKIKTKYYADVAGGGTYSRGVQYLGIKQGMV